MTKDTSITVRIPSDLKERLVAASEAEDRTLSKLVERILREWEEAAAKPGPRRR